MRIKISNTRVAPRCRTERLPSLHQLATFCEQVFGVAGTGGMTSSSGSTGDVRITSISPVEKPVSVRCQARQDLVGQKQVTAFKAGRVDATAG